MDSWKKYNPDYKIIILNKDNIGDYLPDVDLSKMNHVNDFVQRYSDFVRVHVLAKYGGIWMDSSVICQKSLDWIHDIQNERGVEYIGYYTDMMTDPQFKNTSPVIENWTFACTPDSKFVKDWRDEMVGFTKYNKIGDYSKEIIQKGISPQGIPGAPDIEYFAMHFAAQRLLQEQPEKYKLHLICAEETALSYLAEEGTRKILYTDEAINKNTQKIIDREKSHEPLLKIPGYIRERIEKNTTDFDSIFAIP
jgi:hypothetical protein